MAVPITRATHCLSVEFMSRCGRQRARPTHSRKRTVTAIAPRRPGLKRGRTKARLTLDRLRGCCRGSGQAVANRWTRGAERPVLYSGDGRLTVKPPRKLWGFD